VLVDVVGVEQRRGLEGGEQVFGDGLDERLGWPSLAKPFSSGVLAVFHLVEKRWWPELIEGGELGVGEDGGLDLGGAAA
jgi:hypothetical protein